MNVLHRIGSIVLVALLGSACADQNMTNESAPNDLNQAPSFSAISGAGVVVGFEPAPESPPYALGTINGQNDWSSTGSYDQAVVTNASPPAPTSFGTQSLRISNAITSGSFGDQTFSRRLTNPAGETTADENGFSLGGVRQNHFEAQWQFVSFAPGSQQTGLSIVASPDRGDGSRMSWVQMADGTAGLDINFYDVQGTSNPANFVLSPVVSGLDRTVPHTIKVTMDLIDGPSNDVVKVYVDGVLKKTGTSWENYYRFDSEATAGHAGLPPIVNRILFRAGGDAFAGNSGKGFLIDDFSLKSSTFTGTPCAFTTANNTMTLVADCTTSESILIPGDFTLNGANHTITAVDPVPDHFLGAVVRNGGASANVTHLNVTASGLADVCDGGDDRLRGILLDGAGGSITNNTVTGIRQGASGCQEGNSIEVRNAPFTVGGPDLVVTISGNVVSSYQKTGILANGSVAATITGNTVTGAGPVSYIAQNGIQVGFGATAVVKNNTVSGNFYTGPDVACGILLFQADGVKTSSNNLFNNERDICNFGKGGGKLNPSS